MKEKKTKNSLLPTFSGKTKKSGKLDLRETAFVPPPREVEDSEEDIFENYNPDVLELKAPAARPAVLSPAKKKRRRKKKAIVAPISPVDSTVLSSKESMVDIAVPANLPIAAEQAGTSGLIESAIHQAAVAAEEAVLPSAVLAVKKKRRRKKPAVEKTLTQEVPITIIESSQSEENNLKESFDGGGEPDNISFRQSLAKRISGSFGEAEKSVQRDGFKIKVLDNGLRVIFAPMAGTKTITALLMFGTGSKYESLSQNGLSHFLEHMFFKGTKNRPNAQKISSELDALGSEYNAFTSKEYTGYWIKVDATKSEAALDILSDMLLNSKFSENEIDKERGVIIEEINMYHENPLMYIEDVFEKCLYGDTSAGREIIGPKENIKNFKRQNFVDYFSSQYGSNAATLVVSGAVNSGIEEAVKKYFEAMVKRPFKDKLKTPDMQNSPQIKTHYQEGKQANISLGVRTYDTYHPDKIILKVLSVILGGSMSSRLFNEVREKRGLAYYVRTQTEFFTDTGYLTTQAGVPVEKIGEAVETIVAEYKKISEEPVGEEELRRAKDLIRGRTVIAFEESDSVANWYARQSVLGEEIATPEQFFSAVEKVSAEDIIRVAADIFRADKLNLAVVGPFKGGGQFEAHLKFKKRSVIPGIFSFFA